MMHDVAEHFNLPVADRPAVWRAVINTVLSGSPPVYAQIADG
jgi:hypothetical protein